MTKIKNAKQNIPYGIYCYGLDKDGKKIDCKNHKNNKCTFLKEYDEDLVSDFCKDCDIRELVPKKIIRKYIKINNLGRKEYLEFLEQEKP